MTTETPHPGTAHARGALAVGTRAELIQVQATISDGAPAFGVSGVPGISFREARDRVRAAVLNSGLDWPTGAITIRQLSMDSCKKIPPIEGKMSVSAPTGPFFPDPRGNRLEGWTTRATPTGHQLWLRGPAEVARQVVAVDPTYQPCPPSVGVGPTWTHAFASPRPSMVSQVQSLLNLLTGILTLPEPPNVDSALCLDWYKIPVYGVDPFQWQNTGPLKLTGTLPRSGDFE